MSYSTDFCPNGELVLDPFSVFKQDLKKHIFVYNILQASKIPTSLTFFLPELVPLPVSSDPLYFGAVSFPLESNTVFSSLKENKNCYCALILSSVLQDCIVIFEKKSLFSLVCLSTNTHAIVLS